MKKVNSLLFDQSPVVVYFSDECLHVQVKGKALLNIPLQNFPRLERATVEQRKRFTLNAGGGIHWEEIDEDINIEALYAGAIRDMTNRK
ncbi:DUF2442 domain-containing protein [Photorhabdus laumondii subsp. laumondii]|uniref:Photorhabdus luminescens subsp. laumondii TTO1 complete genome segment 16/17 n=2 Tax=Photorhabdus laumondii subsp. laumondii TaxID=141679 RepID=Q7MZ34_PHOLL|nr:MULTISPECIES: DUF2442 domain-containing protein [Photorhabdus]AWK44004.1 hypothetical protein A4R40_22140 [Photorhabdus laumondii subsp. laumondii]AXG44683.1 DUF2442 domain-containing protein [Photorhabdus laumondii subsp. laumondii]AXG49319.1 DUF2442 domain-containing protein [Photorhabdus laumondii subsp. laumondii]MCC8383949.1 DUF2442 domain-containing protein [Photorhabdus laumondii]MCC8387632.1 DUF2442 domain-containing protein [Photorhabdus laumondii]